MRCDGNPLLEPPYDGCVPLLCASARNAAVGALDLDLELDAIAVDRALGRLLAHTISVCPHKLSAALLQDERRRERAARIEHGQLPGAGCISSRRRGIRKPRKATQESSKHREPEHR
jgi:hypothetical protein